MRLGTSRGNGTEFGKGDVLSSATGRYRRRHVVMRFVTAATANRRGKPRSYHSAFSPLLLPSSFSIPALSLCLPLDYEQRGNERSMPQCRCPLSTALSSPPLPATKTASDSCRSATHEIRSNLTVSEQRHDRDMLQLAPLHNWSISCTYSSCPARCFSKDPFKTWDSFSSCSKYENIL